MAYIFNSKIENPERLERMLVARRPLVDLLEKRAKALIDKGTLSQTLLIGPRGSGKTHMLKVFFNRVWDNPKREEKIVVAYMVEDEYGIDTFLDLLIRIFNAFMRWYENDETKQLAEEIEKLKYTNPDQRESYAIDILNRYLAGRDLLIIIENLNDIFQGLGKQGQAKLRDYIQQYNNTAIFASSQALFSDIQQEDKPFQNFFNITHLKKLSYEEAMLLVNALAEEEKLEDFKAFLDTPRGKANVHAVFDLTQGNHRLLVTFFDFLKAEFKSDLAEAFLHTIDKLKPYYESYFKLLSPQQQKIVQYLSSKRRPVTGKDISLNSFIPHTTVSKQMSELQKLGYVESTKIGKDAFYEIAEPMLRLAFEVNENKKGIISIFIEFLTQLYEVEEIAKRYLRFKFLCDYQEISTKVLFKKEASFYEEALSKAKVLDLRDYEDELSKITSETERETYIRDLVFAENHAQPSNEEKEIQQLLANKDINYALERTQILQEKTPNNPLYHFILGFIYDKKEDFLSAQDEYQKYLELKPKDYRAWYNLGICHFNLKQFEKAVSSYLRALEINEQLYDCWVNLGVSYERLNKLSLSESCYEKAIDLGEGRGEAISNLVRLYYYTRKKNDSEVLIEQLAKKNPQVAEIHFYQGLIAKEKNLREKAQKEFKKALRLDNNHSKSWFQLGLLAFESKDFSLAIEYMERAIELDASSVHIWYHYGLSQYNLSNYYLAIEAFQKAISLEPDHVSTLVMLANTYHEIGEEDKVVQYSERVLSINPSYYYLWFNLAGIYKKNGDLRTAIEYYLEASKLKPDDDLILFHLAYAYEQANEIEKAIIAYKDAVNINPKDFRNWNNLILTFLSQQNFEEAKALIKEALAVADNIESLLALDVFLELSTGKEHDNLFRKLEVWLKYALDHEIQHLTNLQLIISEILYLVAKKTIDLNRVINLFQNFSFDSEFVKTIGKATFNMFSRNSIMTKKDFEQLLTILSAAQIPNNLKQKLSLYLNVGIEYIFDKNNRSIYNLTKEERQLFLQFVNLND